MLLIGQSIHCQRIAVVQYAAEQRQIRTPHFPVWEKQGKTRKRCAILTRNGGEKQN